MATSTTTRTASGKVAAPVAFTAIATLAAPPAGVYRVQVFVGLTGAVNIANEANDVQIVAPSDFSVPLGVPGAVGHYGPFEILWQADGTNSLSVQTGAAAATAGTEYSATILAQPSVPGLTMQY